MTFVITLSLDAVVNVKGFSGPTKQTRLIYLFRRVSDKECCHSPTADLFCLDEPSFQSQVERRFTV